jgi:hypothetical protein
VCTNVRAYALVNTRAPPVDASNACAHGPINVIATHPSLSFSFSFSLQLFARS